MAPIKELRKRKSYDSEMDWRLTFNVYEYNEKSQPGFMWHKDIAVNGEITSIISFY